MTKLNARQMFNKAEKITHEGTKNNIKYGKVNQYLYYSLAVFDSKVKENKNFVLNLTSHLNGTPKRESHLDMFFTNIGQVNDHIKTLKTVFKLGRI